LTEDQEKREKHIKIISEKVQYLNTILNDFLSIEKIEKGKIDYKFSTFKLSKVLNEVIYNANMILKRGQQINYPENIDDFSLYQDEKIVELALSNLLYNAIKYSPEYTNIDIDITQNTNTTTFKVKDNGIGIPEKDQKNIFNRYFRAENVLLIQGTGIGLNIVKNHLEQLNGSISFESHENKGSIFTIELPNKAEL
jgi:signal transduction histidine kinase